MGYLSWYVGISRKDPVDFIQKNKDYTLKDVAGNITCPMFVLEVEMNDDSLEDQKGIRCS